MNEAQACIKSLLELPEYRQAKAISLYLSMPTGEISTTEIVQDAFQNDKAVFVPFTYRLAQSRDFWPASIMDMLELGSLSEFKGLKPDRWGIPSLDKDSISKRRNCFGGHGKSDGDADREAHDDELELIVLPGLGFDRALDRLGHGKGYYDFFLQRYLWHSQKAKTKMPFLGM
jgi:5-formyltetrahydrofolate cyclo-ligase